MEALPVRISTPNEADTSVGKSTCDYHPGGIFASKHLCNKQGAHMLKELHRNTPEGLEDKVWPFFYQKAFDYPVGGGLV